jgi:hypothetical protein
LTGCRAHLTSVHFDIDAARLDHRLLRNHDFEHAIAVPGRDLLSERVFGQRETPLEIALDALEPLITLLAVALFNAARAPDRQHTLVGRDLNVGRKNARKIGVHGKALRLLVYVHGRGPGGRCCTGGISLRIGEYLIEFAMQMAH